MTFPEDLLRQAEELTGISERSALIRAALEALVARESASRLIALGGTDPTATAAFRERGARSA